MAPIEEKNARLKKRKSHFSVYFGLLVSVLCIWWVVGSVEHDKVFEHVKNVDTTLLALAVFGTICSYLLRSWRWQYFFGSSPPKFNDAFRCLIVGFFMNNVLPARMGEIVRAHLGGRATGQSRSVVLATIVAERLADGLAISLLFAILFPLGASAGNLQQANGLYYVAYLFLAAAIGLAGMLYYRERIFSLLERLGKIMPGHLSTYTLVRIRRFIQGLEPLLHPSRIATLAFYSMAVWGIELLVYSQVAKAFSHTMSLSELGLFLAAVNFSSMIPAAPGGIGVIEAFATAALVRIGVDREPALAMVAAQHLIQYLVVGFPGLYFFVTRLGGKIPEADSEGELESEEVKDTFADVSEPRPKMQLSDNIDIDSASWENKEAVELSIIIPAFNEEDRLPKHLLSIVEYFKTSNCSYELLVVDDGSRDGTGQVVHQFEQLTPEVRLLSYHQNRGKGYAVRFGVLNARGKQILFADADGATPIGELARLQAALANGADIAIGSRAMHSSETAVKALWYRRLIGRVFNGLVNLIILPGIADTQCGFKLFEREAARLLFSKQRAERFSFDVELLFLARKAGMRIAEVPVNWTNIPGSKVNLAVDSTAMFRDMIIFRLRNFFGGYGEVVYSKGSANPPK